MLTDHKVRPCLVKKSTTRIHFIKTGDLLTLYFLLQCCFTALYCGCPLLPHISASAATCPAIRRDYKPRRRLSRRRFRGCAARPFPLLLPAPRRGLVRTSAPCGCPAATCLAEATDLCGHSPASPSGLVRHNVAHPRPSVQTRPWSPLPLPPALLRPRLWHDAPLCARLT